MTCCEFNYSSYVSLLVTLLLCFILYSDSWSLIFPSLFLTLVSILFSLCVLLRLFFLLLSWHQQRDFENAEHAVPASSISAAPCRLWEKICKRIVYHWVVAYIMQVRYLAKEKLIFRVQHIFAKEVLVAVFLRLVARPNLGSLSQGQ